MTTTGPQRTIPPSVPHYYGDAVRLLMICGAGLALVTVPFSVGFMHDAFILDIIGALIVVALAALTNPHNAWVASADAAICGIAVVLFELDALDNYNADNLTTFILYEAIAILFVTAFYFSFKTMRAFSLHQVGRIDSLSDFKSTKQDLPPTKNPLAAEESYKPDFMGD